MTGNLEGPCRAGLRCWPWRTRKLSPTLLLTRRAPWRALCLQGVLCITETTGGEPAGVPGALSFLCPPTLPTRESLEAEIFHPSLYRPCSGRVEESGVWAELRVVQADPEDEQHAVLVL